MVRNIYCVWFSQSSLNSLASVSVTCRRCTLALSLFVRRMERSRRRSHQNAERTVCSSALWLQRNRLGARVCFSLLLFAACSSNVEWPTFRSIVRTQRRRNGTFRAPTRTQPTVASHMPIVQFSNSCRNCETNRHKRSVRMYCRVCVCVPVCEPRPAENRWMWRTHTHPTTTTTVCHTVLYVVYAGSTFPVTFQQRDQFLNSSSDTNVAALARISTRHAHSCHKKF